MCPVPRVPSAGPRCPGTRSEQARDQHRTAASPTARAGGWSVQRNKADELGDFLAIRAGQRQLDLVDRHVAGIVDMEGRLAVAVRLAEHLDPRADLRSLGTPFVLGSLGLPALLLAEQDEPQNERAHGADSGGRVRGVADPPAVSQGTASPPRPGTDQCASASIDPLSVRRSPAIPPTALHVTPRSVSALPRPAER